MSPNHDARAASNTRLREARSEIRHYLDDDGSYHLGVPPVGATVPYADRVELVVLSSPALPHPTIEAHATAGLLEAKDAWAQNRVAIGQQLIPTDVAFDTWRQANPAIPTLAERAIRHRAPRPSLGIRALTWLDEPISTRWPIPRSIVPLAAIAAGLLTTGIIVTS